MMIWKLTMKNIHIKIILIFLSFVYLQAQQVDLRTAKLYKEDISAIQAYTLQQKGALLIDVRTKREFRTLHAKGAINIPIFFEKQGQRVYNKQFLESIYSTVNQNLQQSIVLICRSGSRTKLAANLLAHNQFSNVYNVRYGFQYDWLKINLPTEK